MSHRCWLANEMEESDALTIEDAWSPDDAASEACSTWNDGGTFAGENLEGPIEVLVRDAADGALYRVEVRVEWDPSFHGGEPVRVEEPAP